MISIPFWKVQSIGNDFVLVHENDLRIEVQQLAVVACRRRFGVGADGLLLVDPIAPGRIRMRMFNPDGTEDFCGNGLRCAANHAASQGWVDTDFVIEHKGVEVPTRLLEGGLIQTQIGRASYEPRDVPVTADAELFDTTVWKGKAGEFQGSALTTGSTHMVIWNGALPDDELFLATGPLIEHDRRFPERTSVIWAVETAPRKIAIRIWERGADETLGCGTGSSAAAVDYLRLKGEGGAVEVVNPGGTVWIEAESWDAPITARGPAQELFRGELRLSLP